MLFGERSLGSCGAYDGSIRTAGPGSAASEAADRIVMVPVPCFAGSTKLPVKVAPACSRIVSPGCAASMAACRLPPAETETTAASARPTDNATAIAHTAGVKPRNGIGCPSRLVNRAARRRPRGHIARGNANARGGCAMQVEIRQCFQGEIADRAGGVRVRADPLRQVL